jgi:hypothetical protein
MVNFKIVFKGLCGGTEEIHCPDYVRRRQVFYTVTLQGEINFGTGLEVTKYVYSREAVCL